MRKSHLPKIILLGVIQLACSCLQAQTGFQYKADLGQIKKTGFYKITLVPEWVAHCKADFSDIRVTDSKGTFIPYVIKTDLPVFSTQHFIEFPILFNQQLKDSSSELVIENNTGHAIHSLLLIIKNNSAYRTATLSGSEDKQKWFVIKEDLLLEEAADNNHNDNFTQSISFPLSQYPYFKLIINDKGKLPVNVLKAGIFTNIDTYGRYLSLPSPLLKQKDSSDKNSYIIASFSDQYQIDRLQFDLTGPPYYKRAVYIKDPQNPIQSQVAQIELTPAGNLFTIQSTKTSKLIIEVINKDDQPLKITDIHAYQINQYLVTYLEAGKGYSMLAGDSAALAPEYDLKYFADTLTDNKLEIVPGTIEKQPLAISKSATQSIRKDTLLLWIIILIVLILLITLSFQMAKAISKKQPDDRL